MSNTIDFPNTDDVQAEAATWLAVMDRGLSEQEALQLQDWIAQSPLHGETLVHYASVWDLLDVLAPIAKVLPLSGLSPEDGHTVNVPADAGSRRKVWLPLWALAASLVIAVLVLFVSPEETVEAPKEKVLFSAVYQTEVGEQSEVVLPDQSRLRLNTNTRLRATFSSSERRVELLKGEAYFDVAKNPDCPFIAVAGENTVTALGTEFNIELRNRQAVEVLVTEGKVAIGRSKITTSMESVRSIADTPAPALVYLSDGQKVVLDGVASGPVETAGDMAVEVSLAWHEGMIIFQGEKLSEALDEISRYTAVEFEIIDNSIKDIEVGGYFKTGDTGQLLFVLEQNFGIKSKRSGNTWLLASNF